MICKACGSTIPDGSRFCTECGAAVPAEVEEVKAVYVSEEPVVAEAVPEAVVPQEEAVPVQEESVPVQEESVPVQNYQIPPQGYQVPPQGYQVPPQGYQVPPQGYQVPPQGYQVPPQGYQVPPQGYQVPPQGYYPQGYAPAPKSFSFGKIWASPTKRPAMILAAIALTSLIVLFFSFVSLSFWGYSYTISGYSLIGEGEFVSFTTLFGLLTALGLIVFGVLHIFDVKLSAKAYKVLFMVLSICFAAFATTTFIICCANECFTFGNFLYFLLGGGACFIYFFMMNKAFVVPAAPVQPYYAQQPVQPNYNQQDYR